MRFQVLAPAEITQQANDKQQLVPMVQAVEKNLGKKPEHVTADAGNFSAETVTEEAVKGAEEIPAKGISAAETMRKKLISAAGKAIYKYRKAVVEPVFGQIKERRGLRRFLPRGLEKVSADRSASAGSVNIGNRGEKGSLGGSGSENGPESASECLKRWRWRRKCAIQAELYRTKHSLTRRAQSISDRLPRQRDQFSVNQLIVFVFRRAHSRELFGSH